MRISDWSSDVCSSDLSGHKIHGPKGIGALWIRDGVTLKPLLHGGGQEAPGRSGTLSPALCTGFGAAAALMKDRAEDDAAHVERLWDMASSRLRQQGWTLNGAATPRYHGTLHLRRDGLDVNRLLSDQRAIAFPAVHVSARGAGLPSHVLRANGPK